MRICVIAPTEEYLLQAGARIRYFRIRQHLSELGIELAIEVIDKFTPKMPLDSQVYVFSKCQDARAYAVANLLKDAGKLIGVDFFDDYFSQRSDSRLKRMRDWIVEIGPFADFALCSTPRMREVLRDWLPRHACHVMNDPAEPLRADELAQAAAEKLAQARANRRIDVAWFGIGDNAHFRVGLWDLVGMGGVLRGLQADGFQPSLAILTNERALTARSLAMLNRLPIPYSVEEWSEEGERELLARSLVCFLPVNGQPFSAAKSLNRCVSALGSATQVLCAGYPLYRPFESFLYRDPAALLADIADSELRVRPQTIDLLLEAMAEWASPTNETHKLAQFLLAQLIEKRKSLDARNTPRGRVAIVHGVRTPSGSHKLAQKLNQLSIGSPFSPATLNYDADFQIVADGVEVALGERAVVALRNDLQPRLHPGSARNGRTLQTLHFRGMESVKSLEIDAARAQRSMLSALAHYAPMMSMVREMTEAIFPGTRTFLSEFEDGLLATSRPSGYLKENVVLAGPTIGSRTWSLIQTSC